MAWEFELDFRQHPSHRAVADALLGLMSVADFWLFLMILRKFRRSNRITANQREFGGDN
jgi:hypothetical protein